MNIFDYNLKRMKITILHFYEQVIGYKQLSFFFFSISLTQKTHHIKGL